MRPASLEGGLNLSHARVGAWYDERKTWPVQGRIRLEGFVYETIDAPDATITDRLRQWLPAGGYSPQSYEQLAVVYRREGNEHAARTVAIGKQRARRANVRGWARWPLRAWSSLLRWTIGYGYRPALALIPLAVLLIGRSVIFAIAYPDQLRPAKAGLEQPGFNSVRYTLDLLLPVANLKQRDSFIAAGWAAWTSFGFILVGWLLAAIVVAGLAGVFKRD